MQYRVHDATAILRRTPDVLRAMLAQLPEAWTRSTEGPDTWSPYDVIGHLIHGERTDWIPRVEHLLAHGEAIPFPPFERDAMFATSLGESLDALLETFTALRSANVTRLEALRLSESDLDRRGTHPEFGPVTLRQHLATWVVHDLSHLGQIARTMAHQYAGEVGPWRAYLSILRQEA